MSAERAFVESLKALATDPAARGLADDCAVLDIGSEALVLTHDMMVEGVHTLPGQDLADVALAGRVIASHYAVPLEMRLARQAVLTADTAEGSEVLAELDAGTTLRILDRSRGWAWGYAGDLVGYVPAAALAA